MPYTPISKEIVNEIIKQYESGKMIKDLEKLFNVHSKTITKYLKRAGIKIRRGNLHNKRYTCNDEYFTIIDTEEKAYFLGFLYADGNVHISKGGSLSISYICNLNLQDRDKYMVIAFQKAVGHNGPIFTKKYDNPNYQTAYGVNICSKPFCLNLIKQGCVPAKSLVLKFPTLDQVPKDLLRHFIRGYFDGDGTVGGYVSKGKEHYLKRYVAGFMSSPSFILSLKECLENFGIYGYIDTSRRAHQLKFYSKESLKKIMILMYKDSTLYLDRKYQKFIQFQNQYESKYL